LRSGLAILRLRIQRARRADSFYIRDVIKKNPAARRLFPADLFADPAWDILLICQVRSSRATRFGLEPVHRCRRARDHGYVDYQHDRERPLIRHQDPVPRVFMDLSDSSFEKLTEYFAVRNGGVI
jgi:hypothetical protein